jgi:FHS family glucose/mannose:H+ symporter-like MFS transporter
MSNGDHSKSKCPDSQDPGKSDFKGLATSIFAGAFVFGVVMSCLGSILPALTASLGFEKMDAGSLFLVMNFAMLLSSLLFGPICDRFGFRAMLLSSTFLVASSFIGLAFANGYGMILAPLAILGLGGGVLNGGTNALLNDISPERRESALNLLGIFFGIGALFTPLLIGTLLDWMGLRAILMVLVLLTAAPFLLFAAASFPAPKHEGGFAISELRAVLQHPLLFLFGFLLFFQSGNEFTMGGWTSTFLNERHGLDARSAAYALSGYWAALMLGRWIMSRIGSKFPAPTVVISSASLALAGAMGVIWAANGWAASASIALVGLGFAPIFPNTLAQAGRIFAAFSGTAFSVIFGMALSGGMLSPWFVGRIAQHHGIGAGFWVPLIGCASIILLQLIIRSYARRRDA